MEQQTSDKNKPEPQKELVVQVCGYCNSWWHQGEFPRHEGTCGRPYPDA